MCPLAKVRAMDERVKGQVPGLLLKSLRVVHKPLNHPREGGGVGYSYSRHWACPSGSTAFALLLRILHKFVATPNRRTI
jgi:hypothetical protein